MAKAFIILWMFLLCADCFAQYTPRQADYSILQRSFERIEQRQHDAQSIYNELVKLCSETAKEMPPSESEWFNSYCNSLCDEIAEQIKIGNTQSAIMLSYDYMSRLRSDKNIVYRIDSYKQYCDDMQNHGLYNYKNGRVTQSTYEWFCHTNPYKFSPEFDASGNLTGYEPVKVSYLYPNLNWNEVYQFVTSQGCSKADIERMWSLYFHDSEKFSSLRQEFTVTKFYYDYFMTLSDNPNMSLTDKERLMNDIAKHRAVLSDSTGGISYNTFVDNLKNQLIKQPTAVKSAAARNKQSKSKHLKRTKKK